MARNRTIPAAPPDGLLDVEQTCQFLGISKPTLYRYKKDADFPAPVKHLGRTWFNELDLITWRHSRQGAAARTHVPPTD